MPADGATEDRDPTSAPVQRVVSGGQTGVDRAALPISHADFVEAFNAWVDSGAVSPPPGKTSY